MRTIFLICFNLIIVNVFSQAGKDCSNPQVISSLPYSAVGLTTNGFGNDYLSPCPSCVATHMTGFDYVFRFIPTNDMQINIQLPTVTSPTAGVGLYLVKRCPDDPLAQLIAQVEGSGSMIQIINTAIKKDSTYYIIVDTYNLFNMNPYTGFSINIYQSNPIDIGGLMIYEPRSSCNLTNSERFVFLFKNWGLDTLYSVPLGYQVNSDAPVYETHTGIVAPNQEVYYTFLTHYDLSLPNTTYQIKMFSACAGDANLMNDTIFFPITNNDFISTYPYFDDFEVNNNLWSTAWIAQNEPGTSWQHGSPSKPVINHAASGSNCWVTDTLGTNLVNENSYVISPCFDFSGLILPLFEMDIWYETKSSDIINVEYTTDHTPGLNINWHRLGSSGEGQNWYNYSYQQNSAWNGSSGGWIHALHTLDSLVGESYVKFRIAFRGGLNGLGEGFAFDNVRISESPMNDLSIQKIKYPNNNCGLTSNEQVKILIKNNGLNAQTDFIVKCSIDGGLNFVTDTVHNTLNFLDTLDYIFTEPFDFFVPGLYNMVVAVVLPGDLNIANDTVFKQIMDYPVIAELPHNEYFENNNGYWYAYGLNSSWEWGITADSVLTSAYSGQKCWATNLSGYHNLAEESYVESPCFDLSLYKNPKIKLAVWYDEYMTTTCQLDTLQSSTFSNLDSDTGSVWYNIGHGWNNNSNGWTQVYHPIKKFAGKSGIKFRFHFKGLIQESGFAFDDFTICDQPVASFTADTSFKGYFVAFNNTSTNMDSCLWNFGDGTTSTLINPPNHNYPDTTKKLVILYVYNSCGVDSMKIWVHPKFVGVNIVDFENNIQTYPNPVTENLFINITNVTGEFTVEIYNIQGEVLLNKRFAVNEKTEISISLKQFSKGIYFVKLTNDKGIVNRKLIKD